MDFTILVNNDHLLSADYVPENLIKIYEPMGSKLDKNYINQLNITAYKSFKKMQKDAFKEGYEIFIDSSYRTYEYQKQIFNKTKLEKGLKHALKFIAKPGGSEHQTGLAIDIIFRRNNKMIEEQKENDPEIKWLFLNAYKYGFILRYPKGKEKITGFCFEPWHFRFVGKTLAKKIFTAGITLEEYYKNIELN